MKARKKPVIVDVMQLKMHSIRSYRKCKEFVGDAWIDHDEMPRISPIMKPLPGIKTLEGIMTVSDGDYIIKGVNGEFYPCKKDIFEKTYNIVKEDDDKDYSGYGFYWNAEERTLVVNGKKEKHVTKATITLAPNMAAKIDVEKLLTAPIVDVQDTVNVRVSHIYPYMND